jgi:hypothetical protein
MIIKQMWISNLLYKLFGRISSDEEVELQIQILADRCARLAEKNNDKDVVDTDCDCGIELEVKKSIKRNKKKKSTKKVEPKNKKKLTSKKSKLLLG